MSLLLEHLWFWPAEWSPETIIQDITCRVGETKLPNLLLALTELEKQQSILVLTPDGREVTIAQYDGEAYHPLWKGETKSNEWMRIDFTPQRKWEYPYRGKMQLFQLSPFNLGACSILVYNVFKPLIGGLAGTAIGVGAGLLVERKVGVWTLGVGVPATVIGGIWGDSIAEESFTGQFGT